MDGIPLDQPADPVVQAAGALLGVHFDNTSVYTLNSTDDHGHGVHVVSWNFEYVATPLLISIFIMTAGLLKLGFHYAEFLSSVVPESCLLISVGTIMGVILYFSGAADEISLEPRTFMLFLLPPIILEAAYSLNDRVFAQNIGTILLFAVLGTVLNFFIIGPCMYGLAKSGAMGTIDITFVQSMLFASFIVAVDPVAVLAIFQEVRVNNVLYFLVFGESLLNDAVTIVLYNTMKTFSKMDEIPASQIGIAIASFFTVSLGGLSIGILIGVLCSLITKKTTHVRVVEPLTILIMAYLSYLVAELFHWSGIISLIGCGLVQAQYAMENISRKSYITVHYFIKMLSAAFDSVIFMFLGLELVRNKHHWHTGFVMWALFLCLAIRAMTTFGLSFIANRVRQTPISIQEQFIMWYGGLRGAVCFALVDTLHSDFPLRNMFLTTTFVVIMFTVFIQGITIKPLVSLCNIRRKDEGKTTIWEELNIRVQDHVMAGIECLTDQYGENRFRTWLNKINDQYLRKWLQIDPRSNDDKILDVYRQMQMRDYEANVMPYYPGVMPPDRSDVMLNDIGLETGDGTDLLRRPDLTSSRYRPSAGSGYSQSILRRTRSGGDADMERTASRRVSTMDRILGRQSAVDIDMSVTSTKDIKKLFRESRPDSFNRTYDPHLVREDKTDLVNVLRERHARARRLTQHRQRLTTMHRSMSSEDEESELDRSAQLQQYPRQMDPPVVRQRAGQNVNGQAAQKIKAQPRIYDARPSQNGARDSAQSGAQSGLSPQGSVEQPPSAGIAMQPMGHRPPPRGQAASGQHPGGQRAPGQQPARQGDTLLKAASSSESIV